MEDVLKLYARPHDPAAPVLCLDEKPTQLHDSARDGVAAKPGRLKRVDYEYVRRGMANVFCIIEPKAGRRLTHATPNRKGAQFARALKRISRRYPRARRIHLVVDNLSTHCQKSLTDAFGRTEGQALWRRFKVHYTPKHASWLNAAEMEAGLVSRECLGKRRLGSVRTLVQEVADWTRRADRARRKINWKFNVNDARRVFRYDGIATRRAEH